MVTEKLISAVALTALVAFSGSARADILVGVGGPLTGPNAAFGVQLQKGAEQAAADINAAGGINGEQIKIVLGDDVSDAKQGVSVANKFVADGVKFVIGHFNSSVSIPASEVYAENGVLQITPTSSSPQFTDRGLWNTFRVCGRDDEQATGAGYYIASRFPEASVAIIHDGTPFGENLAERVKSAMRSLGRSEAMFDNVDQGEKDMSRLISRVRAEEISVLYWGGMYIEAGLIMRQANDGGLNLTFISGDGILSKELAFIAGDAVDGALMTAMKDPVQDPENKQLVDRFREAGFDVNADALYSYAALQSIAAAAKAAGSSDPEEVAKAMKDAGPFSTVLGPTSFDANGDITSAQYVMYEWRRGPDGVFYPFEKTNDPNLCFKTCGADQHCCRNGTCATTCPE
ncbi:ABC transporter substrate-binding protein [Sinorhizobium meliloti]|nr:ABC transporter substrate-binding protein [Sinorhizobium meliloti]